MGRLDRGEQYNWIEVADAIPVRLIGPDERQYDYISLALSHVLLTTQERSVATNIISAFTWVLNQSAVKCNDPAAMIETDFVQARKMQDRFLVAVGASKRRVPGEPNAYWVRPPDEIFARVEGGVAALCVVSEKLAPVLYGGADPSRRDGWTAEKGKIIERRVSRKRFTADTGRRFRFGADPGVGPRTNDPRIYDRWKVAADELHTCEEVKWIAFICRRAGPRFCSPQHITLFDYFRADVPRDTLKAVNKGSDGKRTLDLVIGEGNRDRLDAYVAKRYPKIWAKRDRLTAQAREALKSVPLFSFDGRNPVKYWKFHEDFMRAADYADLSFVEYKNGVETRTLVTPQQLRHEFIFEELEKIEALPADEREAARDLLASYVGWRSGSEMLEWYSNFHQTRRSSDFIRKSQEMKVPSHDGVDDAEDEDDFLVGTFF